MPRKRHTDKRRFEWSVGATCAALDVGQWERFWGGPEAGRAAWEVLQGERRVLGWRDAPFWMYTDGVPAALQRLANLGDLGDRALRVRGLRWLLGDGAVHLRPGERGAVQARLAHEQCAEQAQQEELEDDEDDEDDDPDEDAQPWRG